MSLLHVIKEISELQNQAILACLNRGSNHAGGVDPRPKEDGNALQNRPDDQLTNLHSASGVGSVVGNTGQATLEKPYGEPYDE